MSTFGVGYPHSGWNGAIGGKPIVYVTVNGPYDGGDFGPHTTGTTTGGIQEALTAAQGQAIVMVDAGTYTVSTTITPPNFAELHFNPQVAFASPPTISIVNPGVSIHRDTLQESGTTVTDIAVAAVTFDATANDVSDVIIEGLQITTLTFQNFSNPMANVRIIGCNIYQEVINNASGLAYPTQLYHVNCCFGNFTASTIVISITQTGQTYYDMCSFGFNESNQTMMKVSSAAAGGPVTTAIHVCDCETVLEPSLTGCVWLDLEGTASVADFNVSGGHYLEGNSSLLLLKMDTTSSGAQDLHGMTFRDIQGSEFAGIVTLMSLNSGQQFETYAKILFSNINLQFTVPAFGVVTAAQLLWITTERLKGLTDQGLLSAPFDAANGIMGIAVQTGSGTVTASTAYRNGGCPVYVASTGGVGVSISVKDNGNNTVESGLATLTPLYVPVGWSLDWGGFSVVPTVTVYAIG